MPLSEYKGPSNAREVLAHLPGERIVASFVQDERINIIFEAGCGFWFNLNTSAFGPMNENEATRAITRQKKHVQDLAAGLADGVRL